MLPTLRPGDHLLVRWGAPVAPGRLVVVRLPPAGVSDGTSAGVSDGTSAGVSDGTSASVSDGTSASVSGGKVLAVKRAWRREAAGWWVERDNPAEGVDSWRVGAVPEADVLGVVLVRYWPPDNRLGRRPAAAVAGWARRRAR
jgi:hypothetical protein